MSIDWKSLTDDEKAALKLAAKRKRARNYLTQLISTYNTAPFTFTEIDEALDLYDCEMLIERMEAWKLKQDSEFAIV